jgi:hypothetical protein
MTSRGPHLGVRKRGESAGVHLADLNTAYGATTGAGSEKTDRRATNWANPIEGNGRENGISNHGWHAVKRLMRLRCGPFAHAICSERAFMARTFRMPLWTELA